MIKIIISIHSKPKAFVRKFRDGDMNAINNYVFNTLYCNEIKETLSIDAASWCELATIGETYNEEDFDIYIEKV